MSFAACRPLARSAPAHSTPTYMTPTWFFVRQLSGIEISQTSSTRCTRGPRKSRDGMRSEMRRARTLSLRSMGTQDTRPPERGGGPAGALRTAWFHAGRLPPDRRTLVRGSLRRAHRAAGPRLARDRIAPRRPRLRADRVRQDARRVPLRAGPPVPRGGGGAARERDPRPLRLAPARARERRREEPEGPPRRAGRRRAG